MNGPSDPRRGWIARNLRFSAFEILLACPLLKTSWYNNLLVAQATRARTGGEESLAFYRACLRRPWIRRSLKAWIRMQQAEIKVLLGRREEAIADFKTCISMLPAHSEEQLGWIRSAAHHTSSERPNYPHHEFVDMLIDHQRCPEPERMSLLLRRGQACEEAVDPAHRTESDAQILRRAYDDYSRVVLSADVLTSDWQTAFESRIRVLVAGGDFQSAERHCQDPQYSDSTPPPNIMERLGFTVSRPRSLLDPPRVQKRTLSLEESATVFHVWLHTIRQHALTNPAECLTWYRPLAEQSHLFVRGPEGTQYLWCCSLILALIRMSRFHLAAIAWNLTAKYRTGSNAPVDAAAVKEAGLIADLLRNTSVVPAPARVLLALLEPEHLPIDQRPTLDALLLGANAVGQDQDQSIGNALELLMKHGASATKAIEFVTRIAEPCGFGEAVPRVSERLEAALRKESMGTSLPSGIGQPSKDRIVELLDKMGRTKKRNDVRDLLDEISGVVMDVTPVSERITAFVWLASTASAMGYASNAEDYINSARASCFRYEEPSVRLPLLLSLCQSVRSWQLKSAFPELLRALAMEGRVQSANTWMRAAGYTERERNDLQELQRQFDDFV